MTSSVPTSHCPTVPGTHSSDPAPISLPSGIAVPGQDIFSRHSEIDSKASDNNKPKPSLLIEPNSPLFWFESRSISVKSVEERGIQLSSGYICKLHRYQSVGPKNNHGVDA